MANCAHCDATVDVSDVYCHECGNAAVNLCTNDDCGSVCKPDDKYCRQCGEFTSLHQATLEDDEM